MSYRMPAPSCAAVVVVPGSHSQRTENMFPWSKFSQSRWLPCSESTPLSQRQIQDLSSQQGAGGQEWEAPKSRKVANSAQGNSLMLLSLGQRGEGLALAHHPPGAGSVHTFQVIKSSLVEAACAIIGKGKDNHRLCLLGLCPGDACLDPDTELMGASVQANMNFPTP